MKIEKVHRLRLRDVLVIRVDGYTDSIEGDDIDLSLKALAAGLNGYVNVPIIIIDSSTTLESLSETQMAQAGWIRAKTPIPSAQEGVSS